MLKNELYKVFIKRKLIFLFLAILILESFIAFRGVSSELPTEEDKNHYLLLLNDLSGELTEEKKDKLLKEKALFDEAITIVEDPSTFEHYLSGRDGCTIFFKDADYAVRTGMPVINGCAWRALFGKPHQDLFLVAVQLVYVLLSEISENETNVTILKDASIKGRRRLYRIDVAIGFFLAILLSASVSLMRYIAVSNSFVLSDGGTIVQALDIFENSPFSQLSLAGAYFSTCMFKAVGLCAYTALVFIIGRIVCSSLTTALVSALVVTIPPYMLKAPGLYYFSPISLMQSTGFLYGNVVEEGTQIGGRIVWSTAAGKGALEVSLLIASILIATAFITGRRRNNT